MKGRSQDAQPIRTDALVDVAAEGIQILYINGFSSFVRTRLPVNTCKEEKAIKRGILTLLQRATLVQSFG
ncbi:Glycerol kinase [Orobanche minor]